MFNNNFNIPMGTYPQLMQQDLQGVEAAIKRCIHWCARIRARVTGSELAFVKQVNHHSIRLDTACDDELKTLLRQLRFYIRKHGIDDKSIAQLFAVVREVSGRTLGMRHFPHQLIGARAMMQGYIIEMDTGEGKSLCATLTAASAAIVGVPVHVVTVNEYLACRDAKEFEPLYRSLGLSVTAVTQDMSAQEKRAAYCHDIVYCTNKQITFDYLRDRIQTDNQMSPSCLQLDSLYTHQSSHSKLILNGLHFAIVDEADSVLIDEAVTPLIISSARNDSQKSAFYSRALAMANTLHVGRDYWLNFQDRSISFTQQGLNHIKTLGESWGGLWVGTCPRDELVIQALKAMHLFHNGQQYLVQDGKIIIVDEFTGRTMSDRSWESGLHQMIELKENCVMTQERETLAKISYQRFFRRYVNLAGMTGTAREISGELRQVYGLDVYPVKRAKSSLRAFKPIRYFPSTALKYRAVVTCMEEAVKQTHACLIGTRTVAASEMLHDMLSQAGIKHQLLNAENPEQEASIIALAGQPGQITIATNMAGRGTDIKLHPKVSENGGLRVIATERHESGRIDRQLFGRCGRQGDPGQIEIFLSLDDELVTKEAPGWLRYLLRFASSKDGLVRYILGVAFYICQKNVEKRHYKTRKSVLQADMQQAKLLAFSGAVE